jgi:hypothetical protein
MEPGSGRHGASKDEAWVRRGILARRHKARVRNSREAGTDVECRTELGGIKDN